MGSGLPQRERPKITISRETTFLEGPLRPDGYVDYIAALNKRASRGVVPRANAAIPLLQVLGPDEIPADLRERLFHLLEIPVLPEEGDYLLPLEQFDPRFHLSLNIESMTEERHREFDEASEEYEHVLMRPWKAEEFPDFAALLVTNAKQFELLQKGGELPFFHIPYLGTGRQDSVSAVTLPVCNCGEICRQLTMRAMMRLGVRDISSAWEDILTCLRWGRLFSQGILLLNRLIGNALEGMGSHALWNFTFYANLSASQIRDDLAQLSELPPRTTMREIWHFGERLDALGRLQAYAVGGYEIQKIPESLLSDKAMCELIGATELHEKAYSKLVNDPRLDWNEALRCCNQWFDQLDEVFDLPNYCRRAWAVYELEAKINDKSQAALQKVFEENACEATDAPRMLARQLVDVSLGAFTVWRASLDNDAQAQTYDDFCKLALALAGYRHDHGCYPYELDLLVPQYIAEIPNDRYIEEPLHYRLEGDGYLLYAVGPNGRDDEGRNHREDDVPLPEDITPEEYAALPDDVTMRTPRNDRRWNRSPSEED